MFKKPFSFSGRIRRTEYGLTFLVYFFSMMVACSIIVAFGLLSPFFFLLLLPLFAAAIWFLYAQAAKRSHDVGNTAWFVLIPFYGIYLLFADSEFGPNKWGENPKGLGNESAAEQEIAQIGSETL